MKHLLTNLGINLSNIQSSGLIVFLLAFIAPIKNSMIAVSVLIAIDFIFGIIAAYKTGQKIESKKMSRTAVKLFVYQFLLIAAHLCEKYLLEWIPFVQITLGFFALVEFVSIGESFSKITGQNFIAYAKNIIMSKFKEKLPDTPNPLDKPEDNHTDESNI